MCVVCGLKGLGIIGGVLGVSILVNAKYLLNLLKIKIPFGSKRQRRKKDVRKKQKMDKVIDKLASKK